MEYSRIWKKISILNTWKIVDACKSKFLSLWSIELCLRYCLKSYFCDYEKFEGLEIFLQCWKVYTCYLTLLCQDICVCLVLLIYSHAILKMFADLSVDPYLWSLGWNGRRSLGAWWRIYFGSFIPQVGNSPSGFKCHSDLCNVVLFIDICCRILLFEEVSYSLCCILVCSMFCGSILGTICDQKA